MTNTDSVSDIRLVGLLKDVEDAARLGDNSVVRRIQHLLHEFVRGVSPSAAEAVRLMRPCDEGPFHLNYAIDEFQADDHRRSVFLDPDEAAIAHLTDYHSGRLKSIELRDPYSRYDFRALHEKTLRSMRGRFPVVTVNHALASGPEELALVLRSLTERLISGELLHTAAAGPETCTFRTESLGTRWRSNGHVLEQGERVVRRCCRADGCCGNQTCREDTITSEWRVIWTDGNPATQPPIPPENFQSRPWNNQRPFFADPTIGQLTSDWGWRNINGTSNFHGGIDIAVSAGTPANSVDVGTVVQIFNNGHNSGVVLQSGNTTYTYFHIIPDASLQIGDAITPGTQLGVVAGGGPEHLHYAHNQPPGGNPAQRNDSNSTDPLP